jgi:transposase
MFFDELSNDEWAQLSALVSDAPAVRLNRRGRPRAEPRIVANAVLWILTTGEPWSKLPGRYPSGPTCRRRFEEWHATGTLAEMIRLLMLNGRTFAYIPEPTTHAGPKPAPAAEAPKPRDEFARGVYWKSPDTWQSALRDLSTAGGSPSGWRALAPMADITRRLAGSAAVETGFVERRAYAAGAGASDAEPDEREPRDDRAAAANSRHTSLWMSLTVPRGPQVADGQGYVIYVAAERVPNEKFRASAEIRKDGKRVERSGLIGPRFAEADAAHRFAYDWALQWIKRECRTQEAASGLDAPTKAQTIARAPKVSVNVRPVARAMPELTPTTALAALNAAASVASGNPHLPQHLNAMPLRRYPSDVIKDSRARVIQNGGANAQTFGSVLEPVVLASADGLHTG